MKSCYINSSTSISAQKTFDRDFFLNVIIKEAEITNSKNKINGFKNIEIELNKKWWRNKKWNMVITNGLFKHLRIDNRGY